MQVFMLYEVMDENSSHYIEGDAAAAAAPAPAATADAPGGDVEGAAADSKRTSAPGQGTEPRDKSAKPASRHGRRMGGAMAPAPAAEMPEHPDPEAFEESNLMHGINGYVYGNMPVIDLKRGERVRWYNMALGTEVDLHTPHWHGNTVLVHGARMDVVSLLPAAAVVADMVPDAPGLWQVHCHVNDHIGAGMQARYRVSE